MHPLGKKTRVYKALEAMSQLRLTKVINGTLLCSGT
jgi:hypothetical protein